MQSPSSLAARLLAGVASVLRPAPGSRMRPLVAGIAAGGTVVAAAVGILLALAPPSPSRTPPLPPSAVLSSRDTAGQTILPGQEPAPAAAGSPLPYAYEEPYSPDSLLAADMVSPPQESLAESNNPATAPEPPPPVPAGKSAGKNKAAPAGISGKEDKAGKEDKGDQVATAGPSPHWIQDAVKSPPTNGLAMVAIVIDDMGVDHKRSARIIDLPGPLTTSFLTYASNGAAQARASRQAGHELMVHFPMEPESATIDPGPGVLKTSQSDEENLKRLTEGLSHYSGFVGVNNHMGSKFTANGDKLRPVLDSLKQRGLFFLDSRTIGNSKGGAVARSLGMPYAIRDVFLDHEERPGVVEAQLAQLEKVARKNGSAIAIGHPRDFTIEALKRWLPTLKQKGLVLVPLSTIIKSRQPANG